MLVASMPAGVARTILVRLLLGLVGYGAVTAWFPFMPDHIWWVGQAAACGGIGRAHATIAAQRG